MCAHLAAASSSSMVAHVAMPVRSSAGELLRAKEGGTQRPDAPKFQASPLICDAAARRCGRSRERDCSIKTVVFYLPCPKKYHLPRYLRCNSSLPCRKPDTCPSIFLVAPCSDPSSPPESTLLRVPSICHAALRSSVPRRRRLGADRQPDGGARHAAARGGQPDDGVQRRQGRQRWRGPAAR